MKFSRLVLPGIMMVAVSYGLARFSYGLLLPNISEDLEMTSVASGIISSLFYLSYCFAIVFSTVFTTAKGPRLAILGAGASALVGLLIMGFSPNVWVLALGVLFAGGSTGLVSPPYGTSISLWIAEKDQGKANTWINSGTGLGLIVSGAGAAVLASEWRMTYLIYAFIALIALVWNAKVLPKSQTSQRGMYLKGMFAFRGVEGARPLIICSTILGISTSAFWTFSINFLETTGSYNNWQLSAFWIIIGIFGILGGYSGVFIERFGLPTAYKMAGLVIGAASILLALFPEKWPLAYLSAALFGASYIFITGVLLVWGIRVFVKNPSFGICAPFLLLAVGQVIGSVFAGMFIDFVGLSFTFFIYGLMGIVAMMFGPKRKRAQV